MAGYASLSNGVLKGFGQSQAVSLMACRFMNADGNGSREQAIKCMDWCVRQDAHVLSNSWGEVPDSQSLQVRGRFSIGQGFSSRRYFCHLLSSISPPCGRQPWRHGLSLSSVHHNSPPPLIFLPRRLPIRLVWHAGTGRVRMEASTLAGTQGELGK